MKRLLLLILISLSSAPAKEAKLPTLRFATIAEGREVLTKRDAFIERLSPFDRAARMQTDKEISEAAFLSFVGDKVRAWSDEEVKRVEKAYASMRSEIQRLAIPLPDEILMITTNGKEEGGAAYTRGPAIVLPSLRLVAPEPQLKRLIAHEIFHILSRNNPAWKTKLYALIGFKPCEELIFPPSLADRKITNPDAPLNDHCIQVNIRGKDTWAIPILTSRQSSYDVLQKRPFFSYLQFSLLAVTLEDGVPTYPAGAPLLGKIEYVTGFEEQVGRNTDYIIHPEEILADNFALMILGTRELDSPELVRNMRRMLSPLRGRP